MDRLYGTALRLTRNPDDAEDIVAEAIEKAWSKLDELRDPDCFQGWLFHILNNTFISEWRRRQSRPPFSSDDDAPTLDECDSEDFSLFRQLHQPFLLWWGNTEERFLNELLQEELQLALDALPDPFRVVLIVVEVQGYSYAETAEMLGIPVGTVRSRLNRGRSLLQKSLWQQASDAGIAVNRPGNEGASP
ncbi:RNA polymerase sigma factor [Aidingimonas lacisalsi]|uniref:RNA polymerase sigma factor n=1 Tax=Aidingimonas lacisalsi TaxID=2604086 RepID=UPI0011D18DF0|nr:sigma-70 family RNA polymerase sigma factor [Aidingimonas lacisalsi]